jgi:hypothetical protein
MSKQWYQNIYSSRRRFRGTFCCFPFFVRRYWRKKYAKIHAQDEERNVILKKKHKRLNKSCLRKKVPNKKYSFAFPVWVLAPNKKVILENQDVGFFCPQFCIRVQHELFIVLCQV